MANGLPPGINPLPQIALQRLLQQRAVPLGNQPQGGLGQRLGGLLSGANPLLNVGLGLLASSGPRPQGTSSFGSRLGEALQFANQRELAAAQNALIRQQLLAQQQRQEALAQLPGLLSQTRVAQAPSTQVTGIGGEQLGTIPGRQAVVPLMATPQGQQQLMGLLGQIAPEKFAESLLAQMTPSAQTFGSPIGKMFADLSALEAQGNTEGARVLRTAIERELGENVDFSKVLQVRDDVTRNSSQFLAAQAGFEKVRAAAENESPAGDMSLVFGFMKILDPGSIVREGEFATVENSASVPERIRGIYNNILRGERLTPEQRQDFLAQAHAQFVPMVEQQQRLIRDAQRFAERNKLPFEDIVPEFVMPVLPEPIAPPQTRGPAQATGGLLEDIRRDVTSFFSSRQQEAPRPETRRFRFNPQTGQLEPVQ